MKTGILLFAHGARDPHWAEPFREVERQVRLRAPNSVVTLAFLEFMRPGLVEAGEGLADRGCAEVTLVPLFLGAGGHVRKDVPELLARLRVLRPQVLWRLAPAVGEQAEVIAAMAQVASQIPE